MPTKDTIELGPGAVYFQAPEGQQLPGSITEAKAVEAEETEWAEKPEWPKENPYIKAAPEATLSAEVKISPDVAKSFAALGEAAKLAAAALCKLIRAAVACALAMTSGMNPAQILKAARVQVALKEAPPKVRHLAEHGKKYRTRKKNINRALREYQRRSQKSDRK